MKWLMFTNTDGVNDSQRQGFILWRNFEKKIATKPFESVLFTRLYCSLAMLNPSGSAFRASQLNFSSMSGDVVPWHAEYIFSYLEG